MSTALHRTLQERYLTGPRGAAVGSDSFQRLILMAWTERQLALFKNRNQRGEAPPPSEEFALQCAIADILRRWCNPSWRFTHFPAGGYRRPVTANRMKRAGLTPGWPDFQLFHVKGKVCFVELKRRGGRATEAQEELGDFLERAGHGYLISDSFNDVIDKLKAWGVIPSRVATYSTNTDTRGTPWPAGQQETDLV